MKHPSTETLIAILEREIAATEKNGDKIALGLRTVRDALAARVGAERAAGTRINGEPPGPTASTVPEEPLNGMMVEGQG